MVVKQDDNNYVLEEISIYVVERKNWEVANNITKRVGGWDSQMLEDVQNTMGI